MTETYRRIMTYFLLSFQAAICRDYQNDCERLVHGDLEELGWEWKSDMTITTAECTRTLETGKHSLAYRCLVSASGEPMKLCRRSAALRRLICCTNKCQGADLEIREQCNPKYLEFA
jgi:hypothetical protein